MDEILTPEEMIGQGLYTLGGGRPVQCFTWHHARGQRLFQWNVESAIRLAMGCKRRLVPNAMLLHFASMNGGLLESINEAIIRRIIETDDFERPLIFVIYPDQPDDDHGILIDGWHRTVAALLAGRDLMGVRLSREMEAAIRVKDIIYL